MCLFVWTVHIMSAVGFKQWVFPIQPKPWRSIMNGLLSELFQRYGCNSFCQILSRYTVPLSLSNDLHRLFFLVFVCAARYETCVATLHSDRVFISWAVVGRFADRGEPTLTITRLQRKRLLRVVGVIKLPFNVRMLIIRAALLMMEEYI